MFQLYTEDFVCNKDESFSMTACLQDYVVRQSGCYLDWFRNVCISPDHQPCTNKEQFVIIQETWNWLFDASIHDITEKTGCLQKCTFMRYDIRKQKDTPITWNTTNWVSEFYVYTDTEHVEIKSEYYTYDGRDLLGTVGGFLGYFGMTLKIPTVYI